MNRPMPVTASTEIAAPPAEVWSVVSDVARMSEWSPECRRIFIFGSPRSGLGTRLIGVNRRGLAVWPTTSKIIEFQPPSLVAWKTRESGATWTYALEPTATGTQVTARRDLDAFTLGTRLLAPVIGGASGHDRELADGLQTTLSRIKAVVESG